MPSSCLQRKNYTFLFLSFSFLPDTHGFYVYYSLLKSLTDNGFYALDCLHNPFNLFLYNNPWGCYKLYGCNTRGVVISKKGEF